MLDSEECSLSMEQRENNTKDDVVEIDCISSPQDVFSTLRWRGGILLVPQPTDDPQDPLVRELFSMRLVHRNAN